MRIMKWLTVLPYDTSALMKLRPPASFLDLLRDAPLGLSYGILIFYLITGIQYC